MAATTLGSGAVIEGSSIQFTATFSDADGVAIAPTACTWGAYLGTELKVAGTASIVGTVATIIVPGSSVRCPDDLRSCIYSIEFKATVDNQPVNGIFRKRVEAAVGVVA